MIIHCDPNWALAQVSYAFQPQDQKENTKAVAKTL